MPSRLQWQMQLHAQAKPLLPIKDYTLQKLQQRTVMHILHSLCLKTLFWARAVCKSSSTQCSACIIPLHVTHCTYPSAWTVSCNLTKKDNGVDPVPLVCNIMESIHFSAIQFISWVGRFLARPHIFHSSRISYGIHFIPEYFFLNCRTTFFREQHSTLRL